ncbi:MAG TPA: hypothetical protein VN222_09665, partial [Novosphingobium sp.]|nr:hypothetical protein [Novosphingobium sp.]
MPDIAASLTNAAAASPLLQPATSLTGPSTAQGGQAAADSGGFGAMLAREGTALPAGALSAQPTAL